MVVKYFVFLMLSAFYSVSQPWRKLRVLKREVKKYGKVRNYQATVSVIIPAWNEEVGVLKTLKSVLRNKYPHVEVIVVNDGSTDNSRQIVDDFIKKYKAGRGHITRLRQYYIENDGRPHRHHRRYIQPP